VWQRFAPAAELQPVGAEPSTPPELYLLQAAAGDIITERKLKGLLESLGASASLGNLEKLENKEKAQIYFFCLPQ
jgi:hypothetical protein